MGKVRILEIKESVFADNVAGAQADHAIRQLQLLQDILGVFHHLLHRASLDTDLRR